LLFLVLVLLVDRVVAAVLVSGLRRYHGLDRQASVLCIGHSRTILGVDRAALEQRLGLPVVKYAVNGAGVDDRFAMIRHYVGLHPGVRHVLYDVDAFTFARVKLNANAHRLFEPFASDAVIGAHVDEVRGKADKIIGDILHTTRFEEVTLALAIRGLLGSEHNLKVGQVDTARLEARLKSGQYRAPGITSAAVGTLGKTSQWLAERGVVLWLIDMPTMDLVNRYHAEEQVDVRLTFKRLADAAPSVYYLDLHAWGEDRHELFYDGIHLNRLGRAALTTMLAATLQAEAGGIQP